MVRSRPVIPKCRCMILPFFFGLLRSILCLNDVSKKNVFGLRTLEVRTGAPIFVENACRYALLNKLCTEDGSQPERLERPYFASEKIRVLKYIWSFFQQSEFFFSPPVFLMWRISTNWDTGFDFEVRLAWACYYEEGWRVSRQKIVNQNMTYKVTMALFVCHPCRACATISLANWFSNNNIYAEICNVELEHQQEY